MFAIVFGDTVAMERPTPADAFLPSNGQASKDAPPVVFFYHVRDGKIEQSAYNLADLTDRDPVVIDGYVAGILVFCEREMDILAGGIRLEKLVENADGSLNFDYFGRLNPKKFWKANISKSGKLYDAQRAGGSESSFEKYALFPETILDTVSVQNQFNIIFLRNNGSFELPVQHSGYRDLPLDSACSLSESTPVNATFRYLGNRLEQIEKLPDFSRRMAAIVEGIDLVERTFGLNLVETVNLIDCELIKNAITRVGRNDVWFFIDTFRNESVAELKTIATHEALHLLVDHYRFTKSYRIRELFADLMGYDALSAERFFLLTRGVVKRYQNSSARPHLLFDFINEKHFLDRKGGHSQDNLDEFCTSFLHSLLYLSRIERNLQLPLETANYSDAGRLAASEKMEILEYYERSIQAMREVLADRDVDVRVSDFFQNRQAYIDWLISTEIFVSSRSDH